MQVFTSKSGHVIEYYIDPAQMTFDRYWAFQKFIMVEVGLGADIESVASHFSKLHQFLAAKMNDEAIKEAENLHFNFFSILSGINYVCNSVAAIISKIDDKEYDDTSNEGIDRCCDKLRECKLTVGEISEISEAVKKKLMGL